jgi:putative ABC transport system substrate-binding protein
MRCICYNTISCPKRKLSVREVELLARRRKLLAALIAAGLGIHTRGFAKYSKIPRIGFLRQSRSSVMRLRFDAFRQGLRDLGYLEGKTIVIEERSADEQYERLPSLAAELVRLNVDVIVADGGTPTIMAAKNATSTIPIVFPTVGDPVAQGLAKSLSRPGGNLTGLSLQSADAAGKRLEFIKQVVPQAKRIVFLTNPVNASSAPILRGMQSAAQKFAIELDVVEARSPAEIDEAFAVIRHKRADAVALLSDQMFIDQASRISILAAQLRLPTIGEHNVVPESGGFASYGPDRLDMLRRAAGYVDKILKGAKPADLPIEQPVKFELVINRGTAKALGLTLPQAVLLRADRVIE